MRYTSTGSNTVSFSFVAAMLQATQCEIAPRAGNTSVSGTIAPWPQQRKTCRLYECMAIAEKEKNLVNFFCMSSFPQGKVRASMPTSQEFLICTTKCSGSTLPKRGAGTGNLYVNERAPGRLALGNIQRMSLPAASVTA